MAITSITTRGSNVSNASGSTLSLNPSANLTVGKVVFVSCVSDNNQTTDGISSFHSLADSKGNTWTKIAEYTETDGAAGDGVTVSLFASKITTQIDTTDTITLTLGANKTDKIITAFEATFGAGKTFAYETVGVGQNSLSASVAGLTSREYLLIGVGGSEGEDSAKTADADYVERFDVITSTTGNLDVNLAIHVQTRVATLTSDTVTSSAWTFTNALTLLAPVYEVTEPLVADIASYTLSGQSANLIVARKLPAEITSYSLSGQNVNLSKGRIFSLDQGSYSLSGQDAGLKRGLRLPIDISSFSHSGQSANLKYGRVIAADLASFSLVGQNVTLSKGILFSTSPGSISLSGQNVGIIASRKIISDQATYALVGQEAGLKRGLRAVSDIAGYSLTGLTVSLTRGLKLTADISSYSLTGFDAGLRAQRKLLSEISGYNLNTINAGIFADRSLLLDAASFVLDGQNVTLTYQPASGDYFILADSGEILFSGSNVGLILSRIFSTDPANVIISGQEVVLDYGSPNVTMIASPGVFTLVGAKVKLTGKKIFVYPSPSVYSEKRYRIKP